MGKSNQEYLAGRRFGRLTVIKYSGNKKRNSLVWECACDCGNTTYVDTGQLTSGKTKSCGCLRKEIMSRSGEERKKERRTTKGRPAVECSTRPEANKNSRSGIRGVSWASGKRRWKVQIMYNRKSYHLGYFKESDLDKAIKVRRQAEDLVKQGLSPSLLLKK